MQIFLAIRYNYIGTANNSSLPGSPTRMSPITSSIPLNNIFNELIRSIVKFIVCARMIVAFSTVYRSGRTYKSNTGGRSVARLAARIIVMIVDCVCV